MTTRNYNTESKDNEERKYGYEFDYDVMHPYMLKALSSFFQPGSALELGCFEGRFTQRLLTHFEKISAVEASDEAASKARVRLGDGVEIIDGLFETVSLNSKYNNIFMTHVLEHIADPTSVLKRVNEEWLSESGRFYLVCPNANAPSRQIAVKMGLISHNTAVTAGEVAHGHHRTYTLDTLERDARDAGLRVVHRGGIFFKALANFQWDRLLKTDIVSEGYLEGCYELGQMYPDLCASIFLVCERGPAI